MSKYAERWTPCTKEEYFAIYNDKLSVYSSYTNPDGNDGITYTPQMSTTWGDEERELIRSEARREKEYEGEYNMNPWSYEYYKAVKWEGDDEELTQKREE